MPDRHDNQQTHYLKNTYENIKKKIVNSSQRLVKILLQPAPLDWSISLFVRNGN
jgi:hypothetical protein